MLNESVAIRPLVVGREPEAHQMALAFRIIEVLIFGACVEYGIVLEIVDLAGFETHLDMEGRVFGDFVDQVE